MASIHTFPVPATIAASAFRSIPSHRRRQLSLRAARATRILSHAIEYLANEFLRDTLRPAAQAGRIQAFQLLMALNRQVYAECPELQTLRERCRHLLGAKRF
jgi:hypothetical protein